MKHLFVLLKRTTEKSDDVVKNGVVGHHGFDFTKKHFRTWDVLHVQQLPFGWG